MDNLKGTVHCIDCKRLSKMLSEAYADLEFSRYCEKKDRQDLDAMINTFMSCLRTWLGDDGHMTVGIILGKFMDVVPEWYKERERQEFIKLAHADRDVGRWP